MNPKDTFVRGFSARTVRWVALLFVCAAYLQGGLTKALAFSGAVAEMAHFGLQPAVPMAIATIVVELGAAVLILSGYRRWFGALALAAFTAGATLVANRFWELPMAQQTMAANTFFEHIGLVGAFLLIAWHDLADSAHRRGAP